MSFRYKFSMVLFVLGTIAAIMSFGGRNQAGLSAAQIQTLLTEGDLRITADELAGMIADSDSSLQVVDIRSKDEFAARSIPGAMNIPFASFLNADNHSLFADAGTLKVIYSNNEILSLESWILGMQEGYRNLHILEGGLTEWDSVVMQSEFRGDKISPEENALFEKRYKARRMFHQWNSLSDSLKAEYFATRLKKEKELVGGCE